MSKSLDFCKVVASDPEQSEFSHKDWSHAVEYDSKEIFERQLENERALVIDGTDPDGNHIRYGVRLNIDPEADFSYFTSESAIITGTKPMSDLWMATLTDSMKNCVDRVLMADTYDIRVGRPEVGNIIHYTVGNFVLQGEYNEDANESEITVLLPIRMKILREGLM